ncbi:gamma-glutamyltransferase [Rhodoplanes sp. TEM]|uniref:Glutathione hydrolase proenzyme n=1 Tax=Rhodoplanes tepidamans TaxID=200616 RepID=A0ABT5J3R1_RHOTP|nr:MULTISPECIES: gamma-glutamyltransferase [Rhodoplanes]MDC7784285.1 gamma-glutamyltransferase [Rhodoplanes tepidamans]MDC7983677.1 gamma-glutamyltransferase [Rhodoplanes sp. TEM]MDQ0353687.1 gamma-glutamyltranspeptidase/glutathione hydrolase [Rhodoplanes tepidamans]
MRLALVLLLALLVAAPVPLRAQGTDVTPSTGEIDAAAITGRHGMVASQEAQASRIGAAVLARGGNAVDAAVATAFALAVTLPRAGNLGGGGFLVLHRASGEAVTVDFRETAPAAATATMFLDAKGDADPELSRFSARAIAVPGSVAGLALAHERYGSGRLPLAALIAPAIALARDGVPVTGDLFETLTLAERRLGRWPSSTRVFLPGGRPPADGDLLRQPDLAATLERIAADGPDGFYRGPVAEKIVATVQGAGGLLTLADLAGYRAVVRPPVRGTYRGFGIVAMPPPSSGGVHLVEMLNILEGFDLKSRGAGSPAAFHLQIEAMKLAYADRAAFLGDADQVDVPLAKLLSKDYAAELRRSIDPGRARPSAEIRPDSPALGGGGANTTHLSVVDRDGNAVALTTSLNFNYGMGLTADGTGVLLNNTMDDFSAKPGAPNAFGLVGSAANAPAPGKRPLSSMTPAIVVKDGRAVLVTGAPGGSRIISTVLQVILNRIDFGLSPALAVAAPRVHHQWRPDEVLLERAVPEATARALAAMGHPVRVGPTAGSAHTVVVTPDGMVGVADRRARGAGAAGD